MKIDNSENIVCAFFNPPANGTYGYFSDTFSKLVKLFPKNTPILECDDLNFPLANWKSLNSTENEEQEVLDLMECNFLMQAIDFPTCSKNMPFVALCKNYCVYAEKVDAVEKIYNCSLHIAIRLTFEVPHTENKPPLEIFKSF